MEKGKSLKKAWKYGFLSLLIAAPIMLAHPDMAFAADGDTQEEEENKPVSIPTEPYTPAGSRLTYTFTGDNTYGYVANVASVLPSEITENSNTLTIPAEIEYQPTQENEKDASGDADGTVKVRVAGILKDVLKGNTSLVKLVLPDTVTYIGQEAFCDCVNLKEIKTYATSFESSPQTGYLAAAEIEYRAFYGCTSLTGLTLGEIVDPDTKALKGVKRVQKEAFMNCTSLNSIEIGPTVEWLEGGAFANARALNGLANDVKIRDNQLFFMQDGILYYRESERSNVLLLCPAATESGDLESFPANLTQIKNAAFYGCEGLTSIEIPNTVQVLGDQAFYGCTHLGNVRIPDSVTKIGTEIFKNCGSAVTIICESGSEAERYANSNYVNKSVRCEVTFLNTYNGDTQKIEIMSGQTLDAPTGWGRVGFTLRWSDGFTPNTTVINESRTIRTVFVPLYTVTFRDSYTGYESVVTDVEEGTEAAPPDWTRKGYRLTWSTEAFRRVNANMVVNAVWLISLTDDVTPDEEQQYQKGDFVTINNVVFKIVDYDARKVRAMGLEDESVSKVTIPTNVIFGGRTYRVTSIGANAFRENTSIKKLSMGSNVTTIKSRAFYRCSNLKKIVIYSKSLSSFGYYSFKKTNAKAKVYVPTKALAKTYREEMLDAGLSTKATVKKKS